MITVARDILSVTNDIIENNYRYIIETRRDNQVWTILKHAGNKTQNEDIQNKKTPNTEH